MTAWVIVVTDPTLFVEVTTVVTTGGTLVTGCPSKLVVMTNIVVSPVTVVLLRSLKNYGKEMRDKGAYTGSIFVEGDIGDEVVVVKLGEGEGEDEGV